MKHSRPASPCSAAPPEEDTHTERDEQLWFQDGNLTLVAKSIEFRVYQGPLVTHSPIFKDMLSLPQPDDVDGNSCPAVHLSDAPEDLRHFLRAFVAGKSLRYMCLRSIHELRRLIPRIEVFRTSLRSPKCPHAYA